MARNIIDTLGTLVRPPPPAPTRKPGTVRERTTASGADAKDEFSSRVITLLRNTGDKPTVAGGIIEMVGLDDVRRALGRTWSSVAARIGELAEQEVKAALGPSDFYRPHGTSSFLICFVGVEKSIAEKRAEAMVRRIKERLARQFPDLLTDISPQTFISTLDRRLIEAPDQPLIDSLVKYLVQLRQESEREEGRFRSPFLRRSKLFFAPAWHATRGNCAFNTCILESWSRLGMKGEYSFDPDNRYYYPKLVAQLDYLTLTRALRALYMTLKLNRASPLLVPVTYQTISHKQVGAAYRRLIETMRPEHKFLMMIEVRNLPPTGAAETILEHVGTLQPLVGWVALQLEPSDPRLDEFAREGLWALSTNLERRKSTDGVLFNQLRRFQDVARSARLNTIAHGANSVGLAMLAADAGITYVDGPVVCPTGLEPRLPGPLKPSLMPMTYGRVG
jgi:hypothetical protein